MSWTTTQLVVDYLHRFEESQETYSVDLRATIQATSFILKVQSVLQEAAASASDIHTSKGRAAHHLLVAAEQLSWAAHLMLGGESDLFYIWEKITHATDCVYAVRRETLFKHPGSTQLPHQSRAETDK